MRCARYRYQRPPRSWTAQKMVGNERRQQVERSSRAPKRWRLARRRRLLLAFGYAAAGDEPPPRSRAKRIRGRGFLRLAAAALSFFILRAVLPAVGLVGRFSTPASARKQGRCAARYEKKSARADSSTPAAHTMLMLFAVEFSSHVVMKVPNTAATAADMT